MRRDVAAGYAAGYREQNRASLQLALWTCLWLATLAAARFGPGSMWGDRTAFSWIAVGVNAAVGIGWIFAFARYLRTQDDLWRQINRDALATTLGAGWVVGFAVFLAKAAGLFDAELNLGWFPALLGAVYLVAVLAGWFRYR